MSDLVTIRAGVPPALADAIHRKAHIQGISASAFVRELLALGMGETKDIEAPRKITGTPWVDRRKEKKPAAELPPESETPYSLFARGYSANQIAAVLHMPYREVLAQVGSRVDAMKVGH